MSEALNNCIAFLLLSKYNNAQNDMLERISVLKNAVKACPEFMTVVTLMKTIEIIPSDFPLKDRVIAQLHKCCEDAARVAVSMPSPRLVPSELTRIGSEMVLDAPSNVPSNSSDGDINTHHKSLCVTALSNRVVEHNIRVLSRYYTEIRTARAAEMLGLSVDELEVHLAEMAHPALRKMAGNGKNDTVVSEDEVTGNGGTSLYIRINRPDGIVSFSAPQTAETTLSDWSNEITGLLSLMETTCHLINRENMVYKV